MSGQRDHASNPRGRRKAREGERVMHAERQRAGRERVPVTAEQIRARLDEIAPYPREDTADVARAVARVLAVEAQRSMKRVLGSMAPDGTGADTAAFMAVTAQFAAVHLLMALSATPYLAALTAREIRGAWDDGGAMGELLASHCAALGIDTDEVDRLEEAWQALPEVQAAGQPAEAPPVNLGYMSLPAEVQRDLEAGQGDA